MPFKIKALNAKTVIKAMVNYGRDKSDHYQNLHQNHDTHSLRLSVLKTMIHILNITESHIYSISEYFSSLVVV